MPEVQETPEQRATRIYNEMTEDLFDEVPDEALRSHAGQAIIRYFMQKIQAYLVKEQQ